MHKHRTSDEVSFGQLVGSYRTLRTRLSQHALAGFLGVSEVTLRSRETDQSKPEAKNLQKLLEVFLERGIFTARKEEEEARVLWSASKANIVFDEVWVNALTNARKAKSEKRGQVASTDPQSFKLSGPRGADRDVHQNGQLDRMPNRIDRGTEKEVSFSPSDSQIEVIIQRGISLEKEEREETNHSMVSHYQMLQILQKGDPRDSVTSNMTTHLWDLAHADHLIWSEKPGAIRRAIKEFNAMNSTNKNYEITRRDALSSLVTLPLVTLQLQLPGSMVRPEQYGDAIAHCAAALEGCWQLHHNDDASATVLAFQCIARYASVLDTIARNASQYRREALILAAQYELLGCEILTDREDFGTAEQAGQQALFYSQQVSDVNLQVTSLIRLANIGFHRASFGFHRANPELRRKSSTAALRVYKQAISLLKEDVTPLLKGRTYAGIAEVYAMRGQLQDAMSAMGLAYKYYPAKPEDDPAYSYLRTSRYSLYVFGDAQSRLFLGQPKEAHQALVNWQQENNHAPIVPLRRLDFLYYQAQIHSQQDELQASTDVLREASLLAKTLGSRLYLTKLATDYYELQERWPKEPLIAALEEVFNS